MARRGWYCHSFLRPSVLERFGEVRTNEDALQRLDLYVQRETDNHRAGIFAEAAGLFPHRREIILCIQGLHDAENFIAAVPLLLIQSDGIVKELVDACLFYDKKNKKAKYVKKVKNDARLFAFLHRNYVSALDKDGAFHAGKTEMSRPRILHGEALQYGTEDIALRSLSLLGYVCFLKKLQDSANRTVGVLSSTAH
jgi:hypothetical protein